MAAEARVEIAGEGPEGGSATSLAEERVTLEDMSDHSDASILSEYFGQKVNAGIWGEFGWLRAG